MSDFTIKHASSDRDMPFLLDKVSSINRRKGFVLQLFDPSAVRGKMHLVASYLNAIESFRDGRNNSKSVSMEMLLYVSFTRQIGEAISIAGAKTNNDFIIFSNSKKAYSMISRYLVVSQEIKVERIALGSKNGPVNASMMQDIAISGLK